MEKNSYAYNPNIGYCMLFFWSYYVPKKTDIITTNSFENIECSYVSFNYFGSQETNVVMDKLDYFIDKINEIFAKDVTLMYYIFVFCDFDYVRVGKYNKLKRDYSTTKFPGFAFIIKREITIKEFYKFLELYANAYDVHYMHYIGFDECVYLLEHYIERCFFFRRVLLSFDKVVIDSMCDENESTKEYALLFLNYHNYHDDDNDDTT